MKYKPNGTTSFTIHHSPFTIPEMNLQINMLGPFEVKIDDKTADFRTDALRVLLAYLAANQGTPMRRDTLAGLLSPDRPDKEALTYLRNRLTRLRSSVQDDAAVPPWLEIDRKQITLRVGEDIQIDTTRFDQLIHIVENHAHRQLAGCPSCLAHLQEAAGLVRGELLTGLNFPSDTWESWLINQREHYQQRALDGLEQLREARESLGEWTAVLDIAQRQLTMEPWLEAAHRAIMQAHYHLGDRNAALAQYEQCTEQLWEELGVEPEEETETLRQQILDDAVEPQKRFDIPNNLPTQTGAFFGRETEQQLLLSRLVNTNHRLITLVGAGGIGKTRLSQEAGEQVKESFPDGVWFVPLHAVAGGAEQIKIAIGEAAGLGRSGQQKQLNGEQVVALLRDKQMLLILDNCETVLDDLGFVSQWLKRAPQVVILATSREPLNFQAESVVTLGGLPVGEDTNDSQAATAERSTAVAFFEEQANMARAGFAVTAENIAEVRQICQLVDGYPLGIALAAAWVRRRSVGQIITSIKQSLDFLATRLRDIDPRHKSMRAVFETSWELIGEEEQGVLAALSVFPGSFSADAAEAVAGGTLFDLDVLCEKSLLQQELSSERYQLHSLVRQFARGKLGGRAPEFDGAFVDYYYGYAADQQGNYDRLRPEWGNFSAGVSRADELGEWQTVLDFVQVLDEPWFRQIRYVEMREGLACAIRASTALQDQNRLAHTHLRLAEIEVEQNNWAMASTHLSHATPFLNHDKRSAGFAQMTYLHGRIYFEQGQNEKARKLFETSKEIYEELGDWVGITKNLNLIAYCVGNPDEATKLFEEAIAIHRAHPPSITYVESLRYLARIKGFQREFDEAYRYLDEAVSANETVQDRYQHMSLLFEYLILCRYQHKLEEALRFGVDCLAICHELGSKRMEALVKTQLAHVHRANKHFQKAIEFLQASLLIHTELEGLYDQAYIHCYLYKLFGEIGRSELSTRAKDEAIRINAQIKNAHITKLLTT